ncbi:MAG: lysophospholipid acyltransferase family protein [Phycisphaerales bacterium]
MPAAEPAYSPTLIPAKPDPRVTRVFVWYTRRLFAKKFFAVRLMPGSAECLHSLNRYNGPAIIVMTHGSWWDPMTAILLHYHKWTNADDTPRPSAAPMDAAMLKRFGIFRKLGVFGIDPDSPASLEAMGAYMLERFAAEPRTSLWVTAQGHFHDPRTPPRLRPGAAWLAARTPGVRVLCCAIEYAFWTDQRAETFVRLEEVPVRGAEPSAREDRPEREANTGATAHAGGSNRASAPSTTDWLRAMQATMKSCTHELAEAVIARDPARFVPLMGAGSTRINPFYDLWQKITGRGNQIEVRGTLPRPPAAIRKEAAR